MRLKANKAETIRDLSLDIFDSNIVYLFGSRADDSLKGGDIDIYIQTKQKENILQSKIVFQREFEKIWGEQKLDLVIDNHTAQKEIYDIAKRGIRL